ncbi:P-selectin-like [Pristis pectinata]|uniref:P-selectin-like n=1 Tax=Pristis pectinata TaxID=685728 RepID=UPI00223CF26E|nr:P-selectin-like [Pristis pectinata]
MKLPLVALLVSACVCRSRGLCPNPPPVEFAELTNEFITQQSFTVGQYVIYQCLSGYIWNTSTPNVTFCQPQLTWSKPLIHCVPKDCGEPPPLQNGNYTVENYAIGGRTHYFCNTGYFLVGKGKSLCTDNGWTKHRPFCQIMKCGPPQPISNGSVTQRGEWTYGQQANYSCHEGHTLTGEETIHCTGSGLWSHPPPVCTVTRCDPLQPISNGSVTQREEWTYGQQANYSCHEGHTLTGEETVHCMGSGDWSHPPPVCTVTRCDPPQPISNGSVTQREEWTYGQQANYSCHEGHTLTGEETVHCMGSGNWSHPPPVCTETRCDPPQPISNGSVTQREEWMYGQQANYSCHEGHTLTGEETVHCMGSGDWSHPPPVCTVTRCDPPQPISNGSVTQREEWTYGQQANYSCHEGHTLTGEETVHCMGSGNWSHPPPVCTEMRCDPPQPISNGSVTQREEWMYGQQANYSCHEGHTLTGEETVHCMGSGDWSHPPPVCTATPEDKKGTTTVHRTTDNRTPSTTPSNASRRLDRALIPSSVLDRGKKQTLEGVSGIIVCSVLVPLVTLVTTVTIATFICRSRKQGSYKIG